jgi:hypothetical protein
MFSVTIAPDMRRPAGEHLQACDPVMREILLGLIAVGLVACHFGASTARAQLVDFGAELLLHQDLLFIGAHNAAQGQGRVHLLQRTPQGWSSLGQLRPTQPPTQGFGYALAVSERELVVGGPLSIVGGVSVYP